MTRLGWIFVALLLIAGACTIDTTNTDDQLTLAPGVEPGAQAPVAGTEAPEVVPTPTTVPAPTATPVPTATPAPTAVPTPTATPEPDDTPVLIEGDGWVITQRDYNRLIEFVETTHQLDFQDPVRVEVSDDIGSEIARRFEPFSEDEWFLFRGLGLAESEAERLEANQVRLDRIRGLCCRENPLLVVITELQPSKFETELIIVHELTHALHQQHPDLRFRTFEDQIETPLPFQGATEGVPQFIEFEYLKQGSAFDQAQAAPNLPIIRDDMLSSLVRPAARHLNFAYSTGPTFVEVVVAERGIEGLSELLRQPPTTTEQVLFPEKYLAGEGAVAVEPVVQENGEVFEAEGTVGAAMWWFLLTQTFGEAQARALVAPWAGDSYAVSIEETGELCLTANVLLDTDAAAEAFGEAVTASLDSRDSQTVVQSRSEPGGLVRLMVCHDA